MIATPWQSDSWHGTAGMSLKQLNSLNKRMRTLAEDLRGLNSTGIIGLPTLLGSNASQDFYQLPPTLERCAATLEARMRVLGPKRQPVLNGNVAYLIALVEMQTGRPHDREVGELLGAILGCKWNPESLKTWRASHGALIETARDAVRDDPGATPPLPER
jgi:hypothetical protein